jgi:hypothetical protein
VTGEADTYVTTAEALEAWRASPTDFADIIDSRAVRGVLAPEGMVAENERLTAALQRIRDRECGVIPAWQIARDALEAS